MTTFISRLFATTVFAACAAAPALAQSHPISVAAEYTYQHTNIAPGCSCFSLNGGSVEVSAPLTRHIDGLGTLSVGHASNLTPDGYTLTQLSYTFGGRYLVTAPGARLRPFGQVQLGGAHTSGSLAPAQTGLGGSNAFALETGGGLQVRLRSHLSLIPIEANYLMTTFSNGASNRQNDIRISAGLLYRFGR